MMNQKWWHRIKRTAGWIGFFLVYAAITAVIFKHRLIHITSQYAMPDVDTDGGLWYQWFVSFMKSHQLVREVFNLAGYPFGYDISLSPASNLIYTIQIFFLEHVIGYSWSHLILITNISSLITYPLSALGAALLCFYLTKHKPASFIAGLIFGFSFYHIYMGRGQMSINHIELIPFYFLSLFYFLNKRNTFSLVLSALVFALLFNADAYYAFFSGIFSIPVILFYKRESIRQKGKTFFIYFSAFFAISILTNFNFVVSNLYLFNSALSVQSGREVHVRDELLPSNYYFSLPENGLLYTTLVNKHLERTGPLVGAVLPVVLLFGLFFFFRKRLYVLSFISYLLAIALSSYLPPLFWINQLYFKFFSIFRGVSRLALVAPLFVGLMVGMIMLRLSQTKRIYWIPKVVRYGVWCVLVLMSIIGNLNVDQSWRMTTDLRGIPEVYDPLVQNDSIKVIAAYPMTLSSGKVGFPTNYEILGQIYHQKKLATGASPFSPSSIEYQEHIRDVSNQETIGYLTKYGVDTIVIRNNLLPKADEINTRLQKDERLMFLGRYRGSHNAYVHGNNRSRDVSVYQIKEVLAQQNHPTPTFFTTDPDVTVTYKQERPEMYVVKLDHLSRATTFAFDFPYSEKWRLLRGNLAHVPDVIFLTRLPHPFSTTHSQFHEYMNGWSIDPARIKETFPDYYRINPDGSLELEMTLYFQPYAARSLGHIISTTTLIICGLYFGLHVVRRVRKKTHWRRRHGLESSLDNSYSPR